MTSALCGDDAEGPKTGKRPAAGAQASFRALPEAETSDREDVKSDWKKLREIVRDRYARAALRATSSGASTCCGPQASVCNQDGRAAFGAALYGASAQATVPEALAASLGCGVPTLIADLVPGEVVLDLGSGAGADLLIAARAVAPGGRAIGLDMTPEMVEIAKTNAGLAGIDNVEVIEGYLEDIPLPDASVDVIISNCVINLAADKSLVLQEAARVLRPGGRFAISDVVADERDLATRADMEAWTGCIAGALSKDDYLAALNDAGFEHVELSLTHRVHTYASASLIKARRTCSAEQT
jgi:arsenite methyltransferase